MWFEQLAALYGESDTPIYHAMLNTDIEIRLNARGEFIKAVSEPLSTLVPITPSSISRTSAVEPHPLSDKLLYISVGYSKIHHDAYLRVLSEWAESEFSTPRLRAVHSYQLNGTLPRDIARISADSNTAVRFSVEGVPLWQDQQLISAHIRRMRSQPTQCGVCCLSGENAPLCRSHPRHIISPSSSAKLISYEHRGRLIFQGRFREPQDMFPMSYEVSFRAHAVLRRLILEGGVTTGNRVFVAWDSAGSAVPLLTKQADPCGNVTVLGLTEATKGRLSVIFYRYFSREQYISRTAKWRSLGISPREVINTAYGHRGRNGIICSDNLFGNTYERLLGSILDDTAPPADILLQLKNKAPQLHRMIGGLYERT